jgi:phosphatidylserine/phosphatidylglycerophosphate/cardiolipin synthase-like enzyme
MEPVVAKAYLSPTLVLLALNWADAPTHPDFLGFAIRRTPGFRSPDGKSVTPSSWLPNRIGFDGAVPEGQPDLDSNVAPIQKFMWWDNRIDTPDERGKFEYEIWPVLGRPGATQLVDAAKTTVPIQMPAHINDNGIGTWFNRAVVRSQAFKRKCDSLGIAQHSKPTPQQDIALRTWLANGMEKVVPNFLNEAEAAVGAIYHLTDDMFIIPAFERNAAKRFWMVYDAGTSLKGSRNPNRHAVEILGDEVMHTARKHTNIMHDKFIVSGQQVGTKLGPADSVVMGSANYTTEGLSEQANLMHVIKSTDLAALYLERAELLLGDPDTAQTKQANQGWSPPVRAGGASLRVNFSPEQAGKEEQIRTIVDAIGKARHSVLFCLFDPTDADLRDACFKAGDHGLMMFGLVNSIKQPSAASEDADPATLHKDELAALEIYHRSRTNRDVIDARNYSGAAVPAGLENEFNLYPGSRSPGYPPVVIHHKFIIIDAETSDPVIYTGSANMSNNAQYNNDENLLEIRGDTKLAAVYLAEFMRLYEHYRARAQAIAIAQGKKSPITLKLASAFDPWGKKYFTEGDPAAKARSAMVS